MIRPLADQVACASFPCAEVHLRLLCQQSFVVKSRWTTMSEEVDGGERHVSCEKCL